MSTESKYVNLSIEIDYFAQACGDFMPVVINGSLADYSLFMLDMTPRLGALSEQVRCTSSGKTRRLKIDELLSVDYIKSKHLENLYIASGRSLFKIALEKGWLEKLSSNTSEIQVDSFKRINAKKK